MVPVALRLVLLVAGVVVVVAQNDDLYILIDETSVFNCRGIKNEIKITENDIDIRNERNEKVHYIKAPGNYTLDFRKIEVKENFGYLAGEIGVTLQVPIIEGPAGIRFDLPYTVIPETSLISQKCDKHSGIVERDGKQYCRYCDLCEVSNEVESELTSGGHTFLPAVGNKERVLGPTCGSIGRNSYQFKRTISLPGRSALERMVKDKVQGVDGEIKKRLNKGRGRFQVFLNLITAEKQSMTQERWFSQSAECKCCVDPTSRACSGLSFLYCNIEECKSAWAQMCLHNTARIAACYTVEFNYRMTTSVAEVRQFLEEKGVAEEPRRDSGADVARRLLAQQPIIKPAVQQRASITSIQPSGTVTERCVAQMPPKLTHLKRYCTIFWNQKLCCIHCDGVC